MNVQQRRHTCLMAVIVALALLGGLAPSVGADDRRAAENAPLVELLSPRGGAAVSGPTLRVQALVAAFKPDLRKSFIFNGVTVAGKNAGRVSHVEIAVDGVVVETVEHHACRRRMLAEARVDVSGLAPGPHIVTVTAYQGDHHGGIGRSVTAAFTLDPSLPVAEGNRIEQAATPTPFACLVLRGEDDDDDDDRRPGRLELEGRIVPGKHSDGIDPTRDRVVVALGARVVVIEPGKLVCKRNRCRFTDRHHPVVQRLELEAKGDGSWKVELYGDSLPPDGSKVLVRIGNDWGGLDVATGEAMTRLRSPLDEGRRAQATIGTAGGTVETSDATGVVIRLHVPAGALAQPTPITMTPVATSSLPDSSRALHPGVKLEPEGLVFGVPATLELDFAATGRPLTPTTSAFVLTSPLTTLPLFGHVDVAARVLTARLRHFTEVQGGQANPAFIDLQAWADPILREKELMTLSELETSAQTYGAGQLGCGGSGEQACASLEDLSSKAAASLRTLADAACQDGDVSPSLLVVDRLVGLEDIAQRLTVDTVIPGIRTCMERILRALIEAAGTAAMADPEPPYDDTNDPTLATLLDSPEAVCMITLKDYARCLSFPDLEQLALDKVAAALRTRIESAGAEARFAPSEPHLQRLVTLGLMTEQLGRFDLMTLALEQLASALRALVAQAQQTCRNDVAFGRLLLDRARAFAPAVSAVDPALVADIDRARTNCIAIPTVNFLGTYGGAYELFRPQPVGPLVSVVHNDSQGRWSPGPGARITIRSGAGVGVYRIEVCAFGECPGGSSFFDGPYGLFQVTATQNSLSGQEIAQQRWNGFTFVSFTRNRTISATLEGDMLTGSVTYPSGAVEMFRVTRPFRSIQPTVNVCANFFLVACNP